MKEYEKILDKYDDIRKEIEAYSHKEDDRMVICYTRIITDIPGFHKDMEQYEIYNNRVPFEEFKRIVLGRFSRWKGEKNIFECSLFQNIVEDMILFRDASDNDIMAFYEEINKAIADRDIQIYYLESSDVKANIDIIRKERSDDKGNELWFPLMMRFFDGSPYAKNRGLSGEEALIDHLKQRQDLELRICREIFSGKVTILRSKGYSDDEV
ncbi:MAG: hypothetical protein K6E63_01260 [Lachnospiraceae bacterium]|nr:hypothetical protein [Lachnospiraceae bacterium]